MSAMACSQQLSLMKHMGNNPDWIFYRHDGPVEADLMPRLVAEFPAFRPRWDKHLEYWEGNPAGYYNDITQFVYFVVKDLYPSGKIEEVQRALDVIEDLLTNGSKAVRESVVIGFLEDLQNLAAGQAFGKEAFIPLLGPKSREAWDELERIRSECAQAQITGCTLSKFVEDAVKWRLFAQTVNEVRESFADVPSNKLQNAIDEAITSVRKEKHRQRTRRTKR